MQKFINDPSLVVDEMLQGYVKAHPDLHLDPLRPFAIREGFLDLDDSADRIGGARERDEEGIPLGVDFLTTPLGEGGAEDAALFG